MKKLSVLLLAVALVACSKPAEVKKGTGELTNSKGFKVTAEVEVTDGKISKVTIDEEYEKDGVKKTKKEFGAEYAMKEASKIGKEWDEQIKFLEEKLVGTDGDIELDEKGYPTSDDIKAGCTINLTDIEKVVLDAVKNAK